MRLTIFNSWILGVILLTQILAIGLIVYMLTMGKNNTLWIEWRALDEVSSQGQTLPKLPKQMMEQYKRMLDLRMIWQPVAVKNSQEEYFIMAN